MNLLIFGLSILVIGVAGTKLSYLADRLADRTGLGEALMGGILLGASTSLSGSVLSVISAYDGLTDLAIGNAIGGIAAQTFFLVIVDIYYKKANLEHAAVSSTNIMLSALLVALLSIPIIAQATSSTMTFMGIHPTTFVLFLVYILGVKYSASEKNDPMWLPRATKETIEDKPNEPLGGKELSKLSIKFLIFASLLVVSGITVKISGVALAKTWGISHMILGTLFTAIATSLPELITTFAAVKRNALTLAVGGIVGGNTFDVLFLAFSDIAYQKGSLYHVMNTKHLSYIAIIILMVVVLMMGLIRREKSGFANIGSESIIIGLLYLSSLILLIS